MKNKNILIPTVVIVIVVLILLMTNKGIDTFQEDQEQQNSYPEVFEDIVGEDYFSFPEEKTISFGEIVDEPNQIGDYEEKAKTKEAILVMEYEDEDGQVREAYVKTLELDNENIVYTLRHFTNYFEVRNLSEIQYDFKFNIDEFKDEQYLRETNSGEILIAGNNILIIMSNETDIDSFLRIFSENNSIDQTFLEYLDVNPNIFAEIEKALLETEQKTEQAEDKISEDLKVFARDFWKEWIILNTEELLQYYADNVWFYAGDEWFEEWGMEDQREDKVHEFVSIDKSRLLDAYVELKSEDFEEDFEGMQELTDTIMLYPAGNFMDMCYSENQSSFFSDFGINNGDTIMVVRLDSGDTCTVDGNFLAGEIRFFVIRDIAGTYQVVTDFTE